MDKGIVTMRDLSYTSRSYMMEERTDSQEFLSDLYICSVLCEYACACMCVYVHVCTHKHTHT